MLIVFAKPSRIFPSLLLHHHTSKFILSIPPNSSNSYALLQTYRRSRLLCPKTRSSPTSPLCPSLSKQTPSKKPARSTPPPPSSRPSQSILALAREFLRQVNMTTAKISNRSCPCITGSPGLAQKQTLGEAEINWKRWRKTRLYTIPEMGRLRGK